MKHLLRIIVGEQAETKEHVKQFEWVEHFLWKKGFSGLTLRRNDMNLDYESMRHVSIIEDEAFNNLAITLETVENEELINQVVPELKQHLRHGQISIVEGMEEMEMSDHDYFAVKVYTKEENTWFKKEEYEEVLSFFQEKKAIWCTVSKGIVGYGKDRVVHKQRIFSRSEQTPILIECVISSVNLKPLLDDLGDVVEEGAVFTTPINVIVNK